MTFMAHSDLPLPAYAQSVKSLDQDKLSKFLNTYGDSASKFTIDGGNVGKPIVCAFLRDSSVSKAIMLDSNKQEIHNFMTKQGYNCSSVRDSRVIECVKENGKRASKL